jgi:membrane protein YdbS with pleckstrin-like domain
MQLSTRKIINTISIIVILSIVVCASIFLYVISHNPSSSSIALKAPSGQYILRTDVSKEEK